MTTTSNQDTTSAYNAEALYARLRDHFGARARSDESLARHGAFGVGGPAEMWVTVTSEAELTQVVTLAHTQGCPLMLVGNGSNVLYADAGARGIVVRMADADWRIEPLDAGDAGDEQRVRLTAGAGVSLPKLINQLAAQGWAGLEWGAGVPGTVGGAVVSNAGAHGACTADTLESVRVLFAPQEPRAEAGTREPTGEKRAIASRVAQSRQAEMRTLPTDELDLTYRHSRFRAARRVIFDDDGRPTAAPRMPIEPTEMITGATFLLRHDDPARIQQRVADYKRHRKETQPPQPSAGSVFKNPPGDFSGRLIEAVGLKGTQIGRAQISPRHANFIVNLGGASAADVVALVALARRTVRQQFDVELELEVELRGDW
ncbi:MAG: FAD-binding protein [Ktedonobacterales bacterium]